MKIIIDTNVLMSGIFWSGPPRKILDLCITGQIELIVTIAILSEYRNTLTRLSKKYGDDTIIHKWLHYLTEFSKVVNPTIVNTKCKHIADQKFLEAAIGGNVKYIITGDKHLLELKQINKILIIKPQKLLMIL